MILLLPGLPAGAGDPPVPEAELQKMTDGFRQDVERLTEELAVAPNEVSLLSRRADALFFLAEFDRSVADYERMVELDESLDTSHWRRGIARFYAGKYPTAAHQFEIYHTFDAVDRENGIWRYFSQYRAYGPEKAKQGLLKYRKTDREPFPSLYRLFAGEQTAEQILKLIDESGAKDDDLAQRLFYAHLYIGLNHALEDRPEPAVAHLKLSTASPWGRAAGYGPNYMWHVGRIHYDLLTREAGRKKPEAGTQAK